MNVPSKVVIVVAFLTALFGAGLTLAEGSAKVPEVTAKDGTIEFFDKDQKSKCVIPFVTGAYGFTNESTNKCPNDNIYFFKLHHVPSAATILMTDDANCGRDQENFDFLFKTIKFETITDFVSISNTITFDDKAVIAPGLRLEKKRYKDGAQIDGKLSCVQIVRSL